MPFSAEMLGLDEDHVETIAVSYIGYGVARQRQTLERIDEARDSAGQRSPETQDADGVLQDMRIISASSLLIGASFLSLVYPRLAKTIFRAAAHEYDGLKMPYAAVLALCARDDRLIARHWEELVERPLGLMDIANVTPRLLLATTMLSTGSEATWPQATEMLEVADRLRGLPVGNGGVPVSAYRELANEVHSLRLTSARRTWQSLRAVPRFFNLVAERLEAARANRAHWRRLYISLLPIEPEVLAAAMAVIEAARQSHINPIDALREQQMDPVAMMPLEVATEMNSTGPLSRQESRVLQSNEALMRLWGEFGDHEPPRSRGDEEPPVRAY